MAGTSEASKVVPLEPNVVGKSVPEEDVGAEEENIQIDLDELKKQLGIDQILDKLNSLVEKLCERTEHPGSGAQGTKSVAGAADGIFDPIVPVVVPDHFSVKDEEFKLLSVFEETESFGPAVAEIIAQ